MAILVVYLFMHKKSLPEMTRLEAAIWSDWGEADSSHLGFPRQLQGETVGLVIQELIGAGRSG